MRDVDVSIWPHEVVAIVGPSGAGKSTFLRCLNLLERPSSGTVMLGRDCLTTARRRDLPLLRARIGMVFQSFNLFPHLTAADNIAFAPRRVRGVPKAPAREKALEVLERVGLAHKADAYPRHLSGGQQQRVAIARALAMDPEVMLFDEPTSALDPETVHEVLAVMERLSGGGVTMLVISHELGFLRRISHRIMFMDNGRVLEAGPAEPFFASPQHDRAQAFMQRMI
ncbi:MAG: amino acid ABC transporter ATP-binding protein [Acidimicrobiales bacterium]